MAGTGSKITLALLFVLSSVIGAEAGGNNYVRKNATFPDCDYVEIEKLYADPPTYSGKLICTRGILEADMGATRVLPPNYSEEDVYWTSIRIDLSHPEIAEFGLKTGDEIDVRGEFEYDEECWQAENPRKPDSMTCGVVRIPLYINRVEP